VKKSIKAFAIAALVALSVFFAGVAPLATEADAVYDATYYALRGRKFSIPDYESGVEVVDPQGDSVTISGGSFRANYEGDYVIKYKTGLAVLKVYKSAPEVVIKLDGELPDGMNAGETLYLPEASGVSEIRTYDEYTVSFTHGNEVYLVTGKNKKFEFTCGGEWLIEYLFSDVFGIETKYSKTITVGNDPVIVLQNFPETMAFGESLSLEDTYGYYNGVLYECDVELSDKLGKKKIENKTFAARTDGENVLTFSATVNGKTIKRKVSLNVAYETSSLFVSSGISVKENESYPSGANVSKKGVLLKGNSGAKATYAKTLNLKKLSDDKTDLIEFQPYGKKSGAISQVRVTLTDVYDENNTLSVYWWLNPWNDHLSYMLVEYDDVSVAISNESSDKGVVRNTYGAVVFHNFTNVYNKNCVPFNFRYDYEELAVYSAINKNTQDYKVLDADNTEELKNWKPFGGFKGTEVYLSIELTVSDGGGVVVSEIGGEKLAGAISDSRFKNDGAIQFIKNGGVERGVVGYDYALPVALGQDVVFGKTNVKRTVEILNGGIYGVITSAEGSVNGDVFVPVKSGKYRAVFSGTDNFGKEAVRYYYFEVVSEPNDIFISSNAVKELTVRDDFVLPAATVTGGMGTLETFYQIYYNGIYRSAVPGDRVILNGAGDLIVGILVTDELGFKKALSYTVKVDMDKRFVIWKNMPVACKAGEELSLPTVKILDYSEYGKDGFETEAELFINGSEYNGGYVVPSDATEIKVEARGKNADISEVFEISVIPASPDDISQILIYDKNEVNSEFFETGLTFTSSNDFSVKAPYAVPFYDLSLKLTFLEDAMNFSSAKVTLTSAVNGEQSVTLVISSVKSGKAKVKLNGKTFNAVFESGTFNSLSAYNGRKYDSAALAFSWNGRLRIGGSEIASITEYDSGRAFKGFDGGNVYIALSVAGVKSSSSLIINHIANQSFNVYTESVDETPAIAGFAGELKAEYEKGKTFVMPEPCFGDVLSGVTTAALTVKTPDGKTILNKVKPEAGIKFNLDTYGYYQLVFDVEDGAYNETKKIFRLYVSDKTPPVIVVSGLRTEYKAGEVFDVPSVSVTDDKSLVGDELDALTVYLYLKNADGKLIRLASDEKFKLESAGEYEFIVYAFDGSMNIAYKVCKFIVR